MKFNNTLLTIAFGFLNASSTLDAQQPDIKGVAFEKAIFFQESKRDYKAASELFKSVIEKYKDHELEARYRLSQCQKQLGKNLEYQETLTLLSKEKDQTNKWVKLARKERIDDDVLVHLEKKIIQQKIKIQNSKSQLEALAKKYKISYLGNRIEQETVDSPTEEQRLQSAKNNTEFGQARDTHEKNQVVLKNLKADMLEKLKNKFSFKEPVWEDGDTLCYDAILPDGSEKNFITRIYEKKTDPPIWKVTTLRSNYDESRNVISFHAKDHTPLSSNSILLNGPSLHYESLDNTTVFQSYLNDQLISLARVLPMDTVIRPFLIADSDAAYKVQLYRTQDTRTITTTAGTFECSKIICKYENIQAKIEMWINLKGKHELIQLTQDGIVMQLNKITKKDDPALRRANIKSFPFKYSSDSNLHQMTTNNNYFYRSTIFPSQGISIANLEVNHIRNLPKHLQKDPVAFAAQLEENLRQNKTETTAFLLPKNTEYLTLAGCKGLLYTDKNFTDNNHSNYVSFYGINNQHAISLRGTFNKGKEQEAREELKRILTEDLIPINK